MVNLLATIAKQLLLLFPIRRMQQMGQTLQKVRIQAKMQKKKTKKTRKTRKTRKLGKKLTVLIPATNLKSKLKARQLLPSRRLWPSPLLQSPLL